MKRPRHFLHSQSAVSFNFHYKLYLAIASISACRFGAIPT